jgi:hypothetical protein
VRDPRLTAAPCSCLKTGPQKPDVDSRYIGVDETDGRAADVTLERCRRCGRLWLRYFVEYEAFSRSGRWAVTPITEDAATAMTPELAAVFLDSAEWHVFGGSFWGHAGRRGRGRLRWGIAG